MEMTNVVFALTKWNDCGKSLRRKWSVWKIVSPPEYPVYQLIVMTRGRACDVTREKYLLLILKYSKPINVFFSKTIFYILWSISTTTSVAEFQGAALFWWSRHRIASCGFGSGSAGSAFNVLHEYISKSKTNRHNLELSTFFIGNNAMRNRLTIKRLNALLHYEKF
jgi:hypothetical protein